MSIIAYKTIDMDYKLVAECAMENGWSPTITTEEGTIENPINAINFIAQEWLNLFLNKFINPFMIRQTQRAIQDEYNAKMNAAERAVREQTKDLLSFTIE